MPKVGQVFDLVDGDESGSLFSVAFDARDRAVSKRMRFCIERHTEKPFEGRYQKSSVADDHNVPIIGCGNRQKGFDSTLFEKVAGFTARDYEFGISRSPASEFIGIQFRKFTAKLVLKHSGVQLFEPVVRTNLQTKRFCDDLSRSVGSLKRTGEDDVDWQLPQGSRNGMALLKTEFRKGHI